MKTETALRLAVVSSASVLAGDYNLNGTVDAADYTIWRDTFGLVGSALAADGNGDETVDDLDYQVWKMHFGETSPSGAASGATFGATAPEPYSSLLLVIGAAALVSIRKRNVRENTRHFPQTIYSARQAESLRPAT